MIQQRVTLLAGVGVLTAVCATFGCKPQLPPGEDAILSYLRNARVGGGVRRAWPEGQAYVDGVLEIDAKLQKELELLREFQDVYSLWPREDPRWQESKKLADYADDLYRLVDGHRPEREILLRRLGEAIDEVPASLSDSEDEKASFIERVWAALALRGTELGVDVRVAIPRLEEPARLHLKLAREVQAAADDFDPDRTGLAFKETARQEQIDEQHGVLEQLLHERREAFLKHAQQQIADCRARLETIDKRAEKLEYEYLNNQETYLRDQLEALPKELAAMIEAMEEELRQHEKDARRAKPEEKSKLDAKIAFAKQRIKQLSANRDELQARIGPLAERPGQTADD
jgi:hypothetical protein